MVHRPKTHDEFVGLLTAPRAVTFISVEWSSYERDGRPVFDELSEQLAERLPHNAQRTSRSARSKSRRCLWFDQLRLLSDGALSGDYRWITHRQVV